MVHHRIYPLFMFDRHLRVTQNIIQYPPHHMTYAPGKFEVATSNVREEMHLQENSLYDL